MARTALSLKQCQQLYDRLRVRYFLDDHEQQNCGGFGCQTIQTHWLKLSSMRMMILMKCDLVIRTLAILSFGQACSMS